jgi:mono/diheme cytochrome c family protein
MLLAFLAGWASVSLADSDESNADESNAAWEKQYLGRVLPILRQRCIKCHAGEDADGAFNLDKFAKATHVNEKSEVWEEVGKRLRRGEMPPEGSPRLSVKQRAVMHRWIDEMPKQDLCSQLATDDTKAWYRGNVMSRRLTRTEYSNAIRDLVGISVPQSAAIPSDGSGGEGFDTAGDALFTSSIHVQRYLQVASSVINQVLASDSIVRDRLLGDAASRDFEKMERSNVVGVVNRFARRAWRRPVSTEETDRLMSMFDQSRGQGKEIRSAISQPLTAILISPNFLFVVETESPQGGVQRLTDHQLATRLALFLWSSIPDDELLAAADRGELQSEDQILKQTRRMLADDRARALGENFGLQWLGLNRFVTKVKPDAMVFPEFDPAVAEDLIEEAVRLVAGIFRNDRSVLNLIDGDQLQLNGKLAAYYGFDLPADADWQLVDNDGGRRGGVLTLGAVLMSASYPSRTSPVLRGRWVLEEILGSEVPPPPPGVPALEESDVKEHQTLRQRLEEHRKDPACAACHNRMDPLGFGLENYDALGRWRDQDAGETIDAAGVLPSGESFSGPAELKRILLKRSRDFEEHLVTKVLGFALGRRLSKFDDCVIDDCLELLAKRDHRSSAIIETIVTSYPFQHRFFKPAVPDPVTK